MTPCLSPDEFVDLMDGTLPDARRAHLAICASCETMATEVRAALAVVASAEVPEPPAFFWAGLNARVRAEIADPAVVGWRAWLRWDVLVPMGGLAVLVMTLAAAVDRGAATTGRDGPAVAPATAAADMSRADSDDAALAMMIDLAGTLPEGAFDALGVTALPEMGEAATALSADEQRALAVLLTSAMDRPTS